MAGRLRPGRSAGRSLSWLLARCFIAGSLAMAGATGARAGQSKGQGKPGAATPKEQVWRAEGSQALKRGDAVAAEKAFRQALRLDPHSVGVLNDLAIALD